MKLSRSRSSTRGKGELDLTTIHITRKEPIHIPKHIGFARGTTPMTRQAFLDENIWVSLSEKLSQLISQEHSLIVDYHVLHTVPPAPNKSAEAFLNAFERAVVDLDNPVRYSELRSFVSSFASMFASRVALYLLYEEESKSHALVETIKANPLRNSPAMFILRFFYYFPTMMNSEPTDTPIAEMIQRNLKLLTDFASSNAQFYFMLPMKTQVKSEGTSRVVLVLNKN